MLVHPARTAGVRSLVVPAVENNDSARAYFQWLTAQAPETARQLRPPAGEDDLAALSQRLNARLPEQVRSLYLLHDGQEHTVRLGVAYGLEFLTLAEVGAAWEQWRAVREAADYDPDDFDPYEEVFVPGVVRKAYTTPGWVPLFRCPGREDYFGVDLNPAQAGTYGQVINFGRDEPKKYAAAADLNGFFAMLLKWARAESLGDDPVQVEGHIEDLFGHGGLAFERLHARASGKDIDLITVNEDEDDGDYAGGYLPPVELADEYRALLAEINAYLTSLGRITRRARCELSREGPTTTGGFLIWRVDDWSYAGTRKIQQRCGGLLDRAESLGRPLRIKISFRRSGNTWTHAVHTLCT